MTRPTARRSARTLAVLATLLAACSGSGSGNTTAPSTAPSTQPGTSAPPATDAALAAKAKAAVFQPSDFPAGFQPVPPGEGGLTLEVLWGDILKCLGVAAAAPDQGSATSATFLRGLATQAQSTVEYTTASGAEQVINALSGAQFSDCAKKAFTQDVKAHAPEGATPQPVTEVTARPIAPRGQKALSWRVPAAVKLADLDVPLFNDLIVVLDGNALIRELFLSPGSEFPQELQASLVDKVVERA